MNLAYVFPILTALFITGCELYFLATGKRRKKQSATMPAVKNPETDTTTGNAS